MMGKCALGCVFAVRMMSANQAWAGPIDAFGASAPSTARAAAVVSDSDATDAAIFNPARLVRVENIDVSAGVVVSADAFKINGEASQLDRYVGYNLGIAARIPLGSWTDRLYLGTVIQFPHDGLYDVQNTLPDTPRILLNDQHVRHFEIAASAAVRIYRSIAIGAGFTLLPDVQGNVSIDFRNGSHAHTTDVRVDYNFAPVLGITAEPVEHLNVGFAWRGAHRTSLSIPVDVIVSEQIGAIHTAVEGKAFGEPDRFTVGASYDFAHLVQNDLLRFAARLEVGYEHYRNDVASTACVTLYDDFGSVIDTSTAYPFKFEDTWHIAASLDWRPLDVLTVMAGYGWQTTPVPAQRGLLNILDASHHTLTFGLTGWLPETWLSSPKHIGFSTSARFDLYQSRAMEKYEMLAGSYGYPAIIFEGFNFSWHGSLILKF